MGRALANPGPQAIAAALPVRRFRTVEKHAAGAVRPCTVGNPLLLPGRNSDCGPACPPDPSSKGGPDSPDSANLPALPPGRGAVRAPSEQTPVPWQYLSSDSD